MDTKTYGYDRKSKVPALPGTKVKLCPKSNDWFAAVPRARVCDACRPHGSKARSVALSAVHGGLSGPYARVPRSQVNAQNKQVRGLDLSRLLAADAARHADYGDKPWKVCSGTDCADTCRCSCHGVRERREDLSRITRRNVTLGLQGACDLGR
jgi:hypothetical protein